MASRDLKIKFVRSECPDPYNGLGYTVWTNEYSQQFKAVGFVSNKNLLGMKNYFSLEGYSVQVIEDPNEVYKSSYQDVLEYDGDHL